MLARPSSVHFQGEYVGCYDDGMATIYGGESAEHIFYLLVTGDRNWDDENTVYLFIKQMHADCLNRGFELHVIHGGARGADTCADKAAERLQIPCHRYPAPWNLLKKIEPGKKYLSAGPRRNELMQERHEIDFCLAFHDDIAGSKGTKNMLKHFDEDEYELVSHDD